MAKFHALPIALRRLRPEIFDQKIRPYLQRINLYEEIDEDEKIMRVRNKNNRKEFTAKKTYIKKRFFYWKFGFKKECI